MFSIAHVLT